LRDREISTIPYLAEPLRNPEAGANSIVVDLLLNNLYNDFYKARSVNFDNANIPAYFGGDWGIYGMHLPGDIRAFENWKGPKKMIIGPPVYLDRPVYQYAYESLRWFDHWLKGMDTGIMDEPRLSLFVVGTGEWKLAEEWPLPETKFTAFYLHANGLLSEHEFWPNEGFSTYEDSPFHHGALQFISSPMVENMEICGPIALNLYGSSTDSEVLWFISLWHIDAHGAESLLTRGWLRGSQRALDQTPQNPGSPSTCTPGASRSIRTRFTNSISRFALTPSCSSRVSGLLSASRVRTMKFRAIRWRPPPQAMRCEGSGPT
jgi:hypothetical protein